MLECWPPVVGRGFWKSLIVRNKNRLRWWVFLVSASVLYTNEQRNKTGFKDMREASQPERREIKKKGNLIGTEGECGAGEKIVAVKLGEGGAG